MKLYARVIAMLIAALLALGGGAQVEERVENAAAAPAPSQLSQYYDADCRLVLDGTELPCFLLNDTCFVEIRSLCGVMDGVSCRFSADTVTLYDHEKAQRLKLQIVGETPPRQLEPDMDGFLYRGAQPEAWLSLERVCERLTMEMLWDEAYRTMYLSNERDFTDIPAGKPLPVLMYHCVSDEVWGVEGMFTSPESLRQQLRFLLDEGYQVIDFSDLSHLEDYAKPIIITFDDGYEDNYLYAFPIIEEFQVPVTIFMIGSFFGRERYLTDAEAREMADSGLVTIQSHTSGHAHLTDETDETIDRELFQSRLEIARVTGRVPYVLSYPTGRVDQRVVEITDDYYSLGVRTLNCRWETGGSRYEITRISMSRGITLEELREKLEPLNEQDQPA